MRYIECGIQDKDNSQFFDSSRFDFYSFYIYFDSTAQQADLAGLIDQSNIAFNYSDWNYFAEFSSNIAPLATAMFGKYKNWGYSSDFTVDSTYDASNTAIINNLMHFVDKIDSYNRQATNHDYYDHGITNVFPFAELIVIKPRGSKYVINVLLNRFVTKDVGTDAITYTLNNESVMSKYIYNYSTYESDYTSLYLHLLFNLTDYETINKQTVVVSNILYPKIKNDSSFLYFNLSFESTTSDVSLAYTFFDLTTGELVYLNNRYLCHVKDISTTIIPVLPHDNTYFIKYTIEFLDFDTTGTLDSYMGDIIYSDFTKHLFTTYFFNIRVVKRLNAQSQLFLDDTASSFFKMKLQLKTFFGFQNRSTNDVASDWKQFLTNSVTSDPLTYSGLYDVTNGSRFNLLPLLNSFSSNKYTLPYDVTLQKQQLTDSTPFKIDLFIATTADVTNFQGDAVVNGMYIFNEHNTQDTMVLRLISMQKLNANTLRLNFVVVNYDNVQMASLPSVYHIPSSSWLIQYKYHIYNMIPYLSLDKFNYSNDINNLITMHSFAYTADNPSTMQQNGRTVNV